jgi:hypothetical protein
MRGNLRRYAGFAGLLLLLALMATGCDQVTGGGYIHSANLTSNEKANFGFSAICKKDEPFIGGGTGSAKFYEGQLQWDDHGANVKFHGDVNERLGVQTAGVPASKQCEAADAFFGENTTDATFGGTYTPEHSTGPADEGTFTVNVTNTGKGGINGDTIEITLDDGRYNGYTNAGVVEGGQIDIK